jgi:hypothetical protein
MEGAFQLEKDLSGNISSTSRALRVPDAQLAGLLIESVLAPGYLNLPEQEVSQ